MKQRELQGELSAAGLRLAVLVGRFNSFVTERLLSGALDALTRAGASDVDVVRVPGAMEIPVAARHLAETGNYDAIVCLGAVIRGDTPHFDYVCAESARGVTQVMLETGIPLAYGILTVDSLEQAVDRAGLKSGNKGFDAAMTAIEMGNLVKKIYGSTEQEIEKPTAPAVRTRAKGRTRK
ncbi:MAG: 6,7-dimethyl-8-ribityllumazine synthase [Acidobacteria bacterium]|nr:6,7-dimethyl-8-ribityllumazine synthase [Acidobacteriota bacterium]